MVFFVVEEGVESVRIGAFDFVADRCVEVACLALFGYLLAMVVVAMIDIGGVGFVFVVFILLSLLLLLSCGCGYRYGCLFITFVFEQVDDTD